MTSTARSRRRRRTSGPTVALALIVVVLLVAAVVAALTREAADERLATAPVDISGDPLPPLPDGGGDLAVGQPAPALSGQDVDGQPVSVVPDDGAQVVIFLAHWCPVCQEEVRQIQDWLDEGNEPAAPMTAVSTGTDASRPNFPPAVWLEREGWTVPTMLDDDDSSAAQAYGLPAYPFFVFLDADGNVAGRHAGAIEPAQLQQLLESLDAA